MLWSIFQANRKRYNEISQLHFTLMFTPKPQYLLISMFNPFSFQEDDDDWNDFEEEKAVDYSGLRIQNLQIA